MDLFAGGALTYETLISIQPQEFKAYQTKQYISKVLDRTWSLGRRLWKKGCASENSKVLSSCQFSVGTLGEHLGSFLLAVEKESRMFQTVKGFCAHNNQQSLWCGFSTRNGWKCSLKLWKFETFELRFGCNARRGNEQRVLRDLGHLARRGENMWENCRHSTPETVILDHFGFRHVAKFRKKNLEIIKINSQFFFPCHSCLSCLSWTNATFQMRSCKGEWHGCWQFLHVVIAVF